MQMQMDSTTAKRVVLGSMIVIVITSEVRRVRDGKGLAVGPPVGGLLAAAMLTAAAGPAPNVAGTIALIALVAELATDASSKGGSALFGFINSATSSDRKGVGEVAASGMNKGAAALAEAVANAVGGGTRWWLSDQGLAGAVSGAATTLTSAATQAATGMVKFTSANGQTITCNPSIQGQLAMMIAAAKNDGVVLKGGCWRSPAEQIALRKKNCPDWQNSPSSACSPHTAKPGNSQHEKGLAIDFDGIPQSGGGAKHAWLVANAARFGFYQLPSEGWHWSTTGN